MLKPSAPLLRTPLFDVHREMGARFSPFAGYEMPMQYPAGILKEHLYTREAAGLFDVSHMAQFAVRPRGSDLQIAKNALECVVPSDIVSLAVGKQRYTLLTNLQGGIVDDIIVANCGDHLLIVGNAARKEEDLAHLKSSLDRDCILEPLKDRALIAIQGPASEAVVRRVMPEAPELQFMEICRADFAGTACTLSRAGYAGEDGFEISVSASVADALARHLLAKPETALIGLGARDTLRLEAGLCLYGADIDGTTTPVEAGLAWVIGKARRPGGKRAGGFLGAEHVIEQLRNGPKRTRVGLRPSDRTVVRAQTKLFSDASSDKAVGLVTSGSFGPSVNGPIAMAYVALECAVPSTLLFAEVRGKRIPVTVVPLPFVPHGYKR
jgi:aminomethyltransferase